MMIKAKIRRVVSCLFVLLTCGSAANADVFSSGWDLATSVGKATVEGVNDLGSLSSDAAHSLVHAADDAVGYVNSAGEKMVVAVQSKAGVVVHLAEDGFKAELSTIDDLEKWYGSVQVALDGLELDLSMATRFADAETNKALSEVLLAAEFADRLIIAKLLAIFRTVRDGKVAGTCDKFFINKSANIVLPVPAVQNALLDNTKIPPTIATLLRAESRLSNAVGKGFVVGWYCGNFAWLDMVVDAIRTSVAAGEQIERIVSETVDLAHKVHDHLGDQECRKQVAGGRVVCALNRTAVDTARETGTCLKDTAEVTLKLFLAAVNSKLEAAHNGAGGSSSSPKIVALEKLDELETFLTGPQYSALLGDLALLSARAGSMANNSAAIQIVAFFTGGADEEVEAPVAEEFAYDAIMDENQSLDLAKELKRLKDWSGRLNTADTILEKGNAIARALMDDNPSCSDLEGILGAR